MRNPLIPVYIVTAYLFIYAVLAAAGFNPDVVLWMFLFSPVLVIWMVLAVLKSPVTSTKTFGESFYEDKD